jgi:hypothetical protein
MLSSCRLADHKEHGAAGALMQRCGFTEVAAAQEPGHSAGCTLQRDGTIALQVFVST